MAAMKKKKKRTSTHGFIRTKKHILCENNCENYYVMMT